MAEQPKPQRGVALITALLIVALAAIAAAAMAARQFLDIRRTGNIVAADQAYLFALGVETWAKEILVRDRRDGAVDHLGEDWATVLPPIAVEGAVVAGRIDDLQGRFNLNNLVRNGARSDPDLRRFQRLLSALDLDPRLALAVVDWIDGDEEVSFPDGAEDYYYLGLESPYRSANGPMTSPSELLLVKGMDRASYQTLRPYVHTLARRTTINVNTASAPVLMSLVEGMTEAEAEQVIDERGENGFDSVSSFLALPIVKNSGQTVEGIGVSSDYFMVTASAQYQRSRAQLYSVIHRSPQTARIVGRTLGTY